MARVLFALQVVVFIFLAPLLPGLPDTLFGTGVLLLGLVVLLPLTAVAAIWGPRAVTRALTDAFGYRRLGANAPLTLRIWKALVEIFPLTGLAATALAFVSLMTNLADRGLFPLLFTLGWSALGLTLFSILRQAAEALAARPGEHADLPLPFAAHYGLTPRETEVAQALMRGLSYSQIGEALFISPATAKTHVLHVYEKTRSSSKGELSALIRGFLT